MKIKYNTFDILRKKINDSLTDVTKCYILINYADNKEEEIETLKEEFLIRYNNFCKTIMEVEQKLNETYLFSDNYKKILDLDFYKENLDYSLFEEIDNDEEIDSIYNKKANNSNTRMNFYYNNKSEFGPSTRFHVETGKNGLINPNAKDESEKKYVFKMMTDYFNENYLKPSKMYVKSM